MTPLDHLLLLSALTVVVMLVIGNRQAAGWTATVLYAAQGVALLLMSGLRERLELADVSSVVRGAALTLMIAGILSMAFMGFAGMGR